MARRTMRWLHGLAAAFMLIGPVAVWSQSVTEVTWPARAGRLVAIQGVVRVFDHEQGQWVQALHNLPLTTGDRLSTDPASRAELRIGSTTLRLAEQTDVLLRRVDDQAIDVELMAGSLALRATARDILQQLSVHTVEGRFQPASVGHFRIDRRDQASDATAWRGSLDFQGRDSRLRIDAGARVELWLQDAPQRTHYRWQPVERDGFADSVARDDTDVDRSESARYVSTEMTGWEDLDRNGQWSSHPELGQVWMPTSVSATWEPYRDGRWHWVSPWGWTWVDAAPWGFAPFHYGRWVQWRGRWFWVPGARSVRPIFAPALVTWHVAPYPGAGHRPPPPQRWVPLTPAEPFRRHPHPMPPPVVVDRVIPPPRHFGESPRPLVGQPMTTTPSYPPRTWPTAPSRIETSPGTSSTAPSVGTVHTPPPFGTSDAGGPGADGRRRGGPARPVAPAPVLPSATGQGPSAPPAINPPVVVAPLPATASPPLIVTPAFPSPGQRGGGASAPNQRPVPRAEPAPGSVPAAPSGNTPATGADRKHGAPDESSARKRLPEQPKDQSDKAARQ